jgi:hypothetical protein
MESSFIRKIFLVWRSQRHQSRIIVGEINKKYASYSFKYDIKGVNEAAKLGFINYPDFPIINIEYTNVLDIFSQRLNDLNRSDIERYFDFWEIDKQYQNDKYYLLAQTQGILSTDNFEFLAEYYLKKDLAFISEIAGISNYDITPDFLEIGENLNWSPEPNNIYDPKAIVVKKGNTKLGYVKIVHNLVFHDKRAVNLKIRVKDIEKNGKITRVFISIRNI